MVLSEVRQAEVNKHLRAFCDARVPAAVRNQVRIGFRIKSTEVVLLRRATRISASPRLARDADRQVQICWHAEVMAAVLPAP